jgi:hypothetical protein
MDLLTVLNALLGIAGGILAASGLILSKRPDAKQLIDKLTPYQALIGVGLIAFAVINFVRFLPHLADFFKVNLIFAALYLSMLAAAALLGVLFGMPQILKWARGASPPPPGQYPGQMGQYPGQVPGQYPGQYPGQVPGQYPGQYQTAGSPAEQKALELMQKIAPYQVMIGLLSMLASLIVLLYQFHIIKYAG